MELPVLTEIVNTSIGFLAYHVAPALALLLFGWGLGIFVGKITRRMLRRLKVDRCLAKGEKPVIKISDTLSLILKWTVYLIFIQVAVHVLGLPTLVEYMGMLVTFIPRLIGAVLIIIAGYVIADYVRTRITQLKVAYPHLMASVIFWLTIYIAVAMALPLVGIDPTLLNNILLIFIGSLGLGLAIAIGLGLKDIVAEMAKKHLKKLK
jgi:hypothetical protein